MVLCISFAHARFCRVVDKHFISSNLSCFSTIVVVLAILISQPEICQRRGRAILFDASDPTLECVAFTCWSSWDRCCLVDLDVLTLSNQSSIIVVIPVDEGLDLLVLFDVDCLDLNCIGLCIAVRIRLCKSLNLCIRSKHSECLAREDLYIIYKCRSIPLLNYPVAENCIFITIRRSRSSGCVGFRLIYIFVIVNRRI